MKKIIYHTCILLVISLCSCEDFMDIHEEYIKDGEIMYAPKVESMEVRSGKNRVQIKCRLFNAVFVDELHVYWNTNRDSMMIPVSLKTGLDSVEFVIPNLAESAYTFDIRSKDKHHVWSLTSTGLGSAYGDIFQDNLSNRMVKSAIMDGTDGVVAWTSADEKLFCTEVKYTTTAGVEITKRTFQSDTTICTSVNPAVGFSYRSLFLPEPTAIDTFYTAWSEPQSIPELIDRSAWEIISANSHRAGDGYPAEAILDGDMGTFWHSDWDVPELPYFITIDMKQNIAINAVDIYRRLNSTDARSFRLHVSSDDNDYTVIGDYMFSSPSMVCSFDNPPTGRYLKLEVYESNHSGKVASIAELYVIGTVAD